MPSTMVDVRWTMRVFAVALAFAAAGIGCETREIATNQQASSGGELVFSDDFERDELGENWKRGKGENGSGEWRIEDGWVAGENIKNDPLWLTEKLPSKVRIEFDARAMSETGDLKVEVFGDGSKHESGYILIFGGWDNTKDVIARLDEHGDDRKEQASEGVEKQKVYHWAIERTDGTLRWYMDGELFMAYEDDKPLRGPRNRFFAFNDWKAPVQFDNVEVYDLEQ